MQKNNLGYSLKNILIPGNQLHLKCLQDKLNSFIRRLRWKVFYFDNQTDNDVTEDNRNTYGFESERNPPQCSDLSGFKSDLYQIARSVKFRRVSNPFQAQLAKDTNAINKSTACTSLLIKPLIFVRSKSKIMKNYCRIASPPHNKKSAKTQ